MDLKETKPQKIKVFQPLLYCLWIVLVSTRINALYELRTRNKYEVIVTQSLNPIQYPWLCRSS